MSLANINSIIDRARDALVGKIPDPKGQIDQITNALIYKFMDDLDQASISIPNGKPTFFVGDMKPFAWKKLFNPKLNNEEKAKLYIEGISKLSTAKHLPPLFREIFKDSFIPFRAPDTIALFLNEIKKFPPYQKNSEDLGSAFEYLLRSMGTQGDAGQFRTPRHIINFIVDVVAPTKSETILDPACGTAGFLVSAYKSIVNESKKLTLREFTKLSNNIKGVDIDPQMAKIARVNLYLHGFSTPEITEDDTLTNEDLWGKEYDVILANPPFMTPTGGIKPHDRFGIMANRSEVLFVDYIAEHLSPDGRAGIIVPEGVIFQSGKAYKELRKKLIKDWGLYAVVSLPNGIFNPYSGVRTSILFLDRNFPCNDILFIKVENDGHDLGAQRHKIDKDDLPAALSVIQQWKKAQRIPTEYETLAHNVSKEKIAENGEYNLIGKIYRETVTSLNSEWTMKDLGGLCQIKTGKKDVNSGNPNGSYPFFTCALKHSYSDSYSFDTEALLIAGNGNVGVVKYYKGKFEAYQRTYVLHDFNKVNPKYLYFFLSSQLKEALSAQKLGNTMPYIKLGMLTSFKIPLPPLEVQEQIAAEIDGYQKVIDGAKQVIANWKPHIPFKPDWQMMKLCDVCEINKDNLNVIDDIEYAYIDISSVENGTGKINFNNLILGKNLPTRAKRKVKNGDVLLSTVRPNLKAFVQLKNLPKNPIASTGFAILSPKKVLESGWIYQLLFTNVLQDQMIAKMDKGAYPSINQNDVKNLKIPLPPLEVQRKIVTEIESEQRAITECKTLIAKMERKIADKIGEVWGNKK